MSDWVLSFLNTPFLERVLPPEALGLGRLMRAPPLPLHGGPLRGRRFGLGLTLGVGLRWGELARICLVRGGARGVGALCPRSYVFIARFDWGGEASAAAGACASCLSGQVWGWLTRSSKGPPKTR